MIKLVSAGMFDSVLTKYFRLHFKHMSKNFFSSIPPPISKSSSSKRNNNSNNSTTQGPVSYFSLGVAAMAFGSVLIYYRIKKEQNIENINHQKPINAGKPSLGGTWTLVDQDGIPRTSADYIGKFTLLYFGFTHCPDICPSELVKVGKVMNELGTISYYSYQYNIHYKLTSQV